MILLSRLGGSGGQRASRHKVWEGQNCSMVPGVTSPAMSLNQYHVNTFSPRARSFKFVPVQGKHVSPNLSATNWQVGNKSFNPATVKLFSTCLAEKETEGNVRVLAGPKEFQNLRRICWRLFKAFLSCDGRATVKRNARQGIPNLAPKAKYRKHFCPSFETGYFSHSVYLDVFWFQFGLDWCWYPLHWSYQFLLSVCRFTSTYWS